MINKQKWGNIRGFTLIELMVVIAVLAILAGITVIGYGKWRESVAQKEVQSDLQMVAAAMESAKNFGSGYPGSVPSSYKPSPNVTVTYVSGNAQEYCIKGTSSGVTYHIDSSKSKQPLLGECIGSLAGSWAMNGNLDDGTAYGNNGTVFGGVSLTADRNGQSASAYALNGSVSSYITVPFNSTAPPTSQITLALWAKKTGNGSNSPRAIMISSNDTYIDSCYVGEVLFSLNTNIGQRLITGGNCPVTNAWHHYVATYNGTQAQLYVDGALVGSRNYSGETVINDNSAVSIGRYSGGGYTLNGSVDDARMYSQALSAGQVQSLYVNGPQ